jgi:hypothetical protein
MTFAVEARRRLSYSDGYHEKHIKQQYQRVTAFSVERHPGLSVGTASGDACCAFRIVEFQQ